MADKKYQFMILNEYEWDVLKPNSFDKRNFSKALTDFGQEGWYIVAVNHIEKDKKLYSIVMMQRENK